jgi:hypothetical protein
VCGVTFDAILRSPFLETLFSTVLLTPGILSKLSWAGAISNKPRWVIENVTKN